MKATRALLGKRVNAAQLRDRSRQSVVVDATDELSIHIDFHG